MKTLYLAAAVATVYQRNRYDLSLDYAGKLHPRLNEEQSQWVKKLLTSQ